MEYEKINKHCEIHHSEMEEKEIPILFGLPIFPKNYREDMEKKFPNWGEPELGGCCLPLPGQRTGTKMWICTLCEKAREEWVKIQGYEDF